MGFGGISIWQLFIILVIVLLLFGTRKLRGIGSDLGGAIKGFKDSMSDREKAEEAEETAPMDNSATSKAKAADGSSKAADGSSKTADGSSKTADGSGKTSSSP